MSPTAKLRLIQLGGIVLTLACMALVYARQDLAEVPLATRHWFAIIAGVYSPIWGFTIQRRLQRRPSRSPKSTAFTRWRAGHIARLWTATNVGAAALLLSEWGGPHLVVNALFAVGLVLLLFWSPGAVPEQSQTNS